MRKTSRNRLIGLGSIGLTMAIVATGCAGGGDAGGDADESGPVEISFSNWEFLEAGKGDTIWAAMEDYSGPDGNVTLLKSSEPYGSYADKMATEIGAKGGPDVMVLQDSQFQTFANAGVLVPLDDVAEEFADTLNGTNDFGVVDGTQYGFTWEQSNYALVYNKDVIAQAGVEIPTTFDELLAAAKTVQEKLGIYGFANRANIAELDGWTLEMANWIYGNGGGLSTDDELTIDSDENVKAVEEFVEMFRSGVVPTGDNSSTLRSKFAQNQVGFLFENAGVASTITQDPKNLVNGLNIGVSPLPFPDPGAHTQLIIAVNANSEHPEAAKDFVRFLLSEDGQSSLRTALTTTTMATDIPLDPGFLEENPFAETYIELGKSSHVSVIPGFADDSKAIWQEFLTAVQGLVINGGDVRAQLGEVQQKVAAEFGR